MASGPSSTHIQMRGVLSSACAHSWEGRSNNRFTPPPLPYLSIGCSKGGQPAVPDYSGSSRCDTGLSPFRHNRLQIQIRFPTDAGEGSPGAVLVSKGLCPEVNNVPQIQSLFQFTPLSQGRNPYQRLKPPLPAWPGRDAGLREIPQGQPRRPPTEQRGTLRPGPLALEEASS